MRKKQITDKTSKCDLGFMIEGLTFYESLYLQKTKTLSCLKNKININRRYKIHFFSFNILKVTKTCF